jgi:hypothetical protein
MVYYINEKEYIQQLYERVTKCEVILHFMHRDLVERFPESKKTNNRRVKKLKKLTTEIEQLLKQEKAVFINEACEVLSDDFENTNPQYPQKPTGY